MIDIARIEAAFTSDYWSWCCFEGDEYPRTLIAFLRERLPHLDPHEWPERLAWGGTYVNGVQQCSDTPLPCPCKIEHYEPRFSRQEAAQYFAQVDERHIVHFDHDLLVIYKPPRLPTMPGREQQRFNLKSAAERLVGRTVHVPSRIDMSAQGLVIMSCAPELHGELQRTFEQRRITKRYRCVTASPVTRDAWEERGPIAKDPRHPVLRTVAPHGKPSCTRFTVLHRVPVGDATHTLMEANLMTGRTHQIRVHAAHAGAPLVGDNFYGGAPASELHLLCYELELLHPRSGEPLRIRVPDELCPTWARLE